MADTGAPWNIPFVEPTDIPRTYPQDSEDLALAVAAGLSAAANAGIGSNVVQTVKLDTFSTTSATYEDVTGMAATITPTAASSKVLIIVQATVGSTIDSLAGPYIRITGGNAADYVGNADGSKTRTIAAWASVTGFAPNYLMPPFTAVYLDSPNVTTATVYQLQLRRGAAGTAFINRTGADENFDGRGGRGASSITVIEVAA